MTANPAELIERIVDESANAWGIDRGAILGRFTANDVCAARRLAMSLSRHLTSLSFQDIGEFFMRTHGAVSHACEVMTERLLEGNNPEALHFHELRNRLGNAPACPEAKRYF